MERKDYWKWAIETFGKDSLKKLIEDHPQKERLFLNEEEKAYVMELLNE